MKRTQTRQVVIAAVAGIAGYAIQALATGAFAQVWPGRMVSLPIAILLGPWFGLMAGAITLSGASNAMLLGVGLLEAFVVGAAAQRRGSANSRRLPRVAGHRRRGRARTGPVRRRELVGRLALCPAAAPRRHVRSRAGRPAGRTARAPPRPRPGADVAPQRLCIPRLRAGRRRAGAPAQRRLGPCARRYRQEETGSVRIFELANSTSERITEYVKANTRVVEMLASSLGTLAEGSQTKRGHAALVLHQDSIPRSTTSPSSIDRDS